jgi:hypothetical protein
MLHLVRLLDDDTKKEWLVVRDTPTKEMTVEEAKEVMRLEWNDDLMSWMGTDDNEDRIKKGDIDVFFEYRRQHKLI